MPKNRKEHRKLCRLNGIKSKQMQAKRAAHQRDLQVLQQVFNHTDALRSKRPELFATVLDSVAQLAKEAGVSVESVMTDGVMVIGEDGQHIAKSPQEILRDITQLHHTFAAQAKPVNGMPANIAILDEPPSIERQREAATNVRRGLESIDLATCSDVALQEAISMGHQPAVTEWLRRHPDTEASDGGRLG